MSTPLANFRAYIPQILMAMPLTSTALTVWVLNLIILSLDYLNYVKQRKRLGDIPVVGDSSYLWRHL